MDETQHLGNYTKALNKNNKTCFGAMFENFHSTWCYSNNLIIIYFWHL
jgi:hypothetical protein